jgi:hypothetical protein
MSIYEGKRWAVLHIVGYGPNRSGMYYRGNGTDGSPRLVDDRYRAKTWATQDTAERYARALGPRYKAVEVHL